MVFMKGLSQRQIGNWHIRKGKNGVKYEKIHSLDHEHILSGILKCPLCGSGNVWKCEPKEKKMELCIRIILYAANTVV